MAKVRWLDAEQQATWRAYLRATSLLSEAIAAQLHEDSGLPHAYYEILVQLSEAPNRALRMSELANRSLSSRSRLSHAVARLTERGWVERIDCPTDRRGQIAHLTDTGFAALQAAAPGHVERVRSALFDPLTTEQVHQLRHIVETVANTIEAERDAGDAGGAHRAPECE